MRSIPSYGDSPDSCKIKVCESLGKGIVLDVGCLSRIYEPYCRGTYVGVDLFVHNKDQKPDALCDAQHLPFRNGAASSILAFDVIEHLPLSSLFFTECFRVLTDDGKVFITTPNGPRSPFANADPTHVSIYTQSRLREALKSAGFDIQFDNVFYIHSPKLAILKRLPHSLGNWLASKLVSNIFAVATKKAQNSNVNSNRLRILALANDPPSYVIGFSLVFIEICRLLSSAGHTVRLISRKGGAVERVLGKSPMELRLSTPGSGRLAAALFILESIVTGLRIAPSYEIVFSCDIECMPALVIGKLRGLKTAVLFFDVYPLSEWTHFQKSLLGKIFVALIVLTTYVSLRFFDAILSISPYTEELIRKEGLSRSLIRTVGLPIGEA